MSKASEDAFDLLQKQAIEKQEILLYFVAILPDGQAVNVVNTMTPEALEEIGQIRHFDDQVKAREYWERRGSKMARIMTRVTNPMVINLLEASLRIYTGQNDGSKQKP
jgi:hypothetical protein